MNRTLIQTVFYILSLLMLGIGCGLVVFRCRDEMEQKGTLTALVRAGMKRTGEELKNLLKLRAGWKEPLQKALQRKTDLGIYDSMLLLKNLALAEKEQAFSADYI